MSDTPDDDFVASIAPDVMRCLSNARLFDKLDDLLCPADGTAVHQECRGDFTLSESVLRQSGFNSEDVADILDVLRFHGACCDCEVLCNVAETSRLKAKYWRNSLQDTERKRVSHADSNLQ